MHFIIALNFLKKKDVSRVYSKSSDMSLKYWLAADEVLVFTVYYKNIRNINSKIIKVILRNINVLCSMDGKYLYSCLNFNVSDSDEAFHSLVGRCIIDKMLYRQKIVHKYYKNINSFGKIGKEEG